MGSHIYTTLSKEQVQSLFSSVQKKLKENQFLNSDLYKGTSEIEIHCDIIKEDALTKVKALKKADVDKKEEQNRNLKKIWEIADEEGGKILTWNKLNEYLAFIENPKEIVVSSGNFIQYNTIALYLGHWGIMEYVSDQPKFMYNYLKEYRKDDELKKIGVADPKNDTYLQNENILGLNKSRMNLRTSLIIVVLISLLIFGIGISFLDIFYQGGDKFLDDKIGVLILEFNGDEAKTRHRELTQVINIFAIDSNLNVEADFLNEPIEAVSVKGHEKARKVGRKSGASLVIWGNYFNGNLFQTEITIVDEELHQQFFGDRSKALSFTIETNINLPPIVLEKPIVITSFIQGYERFLKEDYTTALKYFLRISDDLNSTEAKETNINLLIGDCFMSKFYKNGMDTASLNIAKEYYMMELDIDSLEFKVYTQLAKIDLFKGDYFACIDNIKKAEYLGELKYQVDNVLGMVENSMGNYKKAIRYLKYALSNNKTHYPIKFNIGYSYYKLSQYDKAMYYFKQVEYVNTADILNNIASTYDAWGKNDLAIEYYSKSLEKDSLFYGTWYNLGKYYGKQKIFDSAIINYDKALTIKRDFYDAWNNLGNIYLAIDSLTEADSCLFNALTITPERQQAWKGIASLSNKYLTKDKSEKSINAVIRGIDYAEKRTTELFDLGAKYSYQEKPFKALNSYERASKISFESFNLWSALGNIHFKKGDFNDAINAYSEAIKRNSNDISSLLNKGVCLIELEKLEQAKNTFESAVQLGSNHDGNIFLGYISLVNHDMEKTNELFEIARSNYLSESDFLVAFSHIFSLFEKYGATRSDCDHILNRLNIHEKSN